MHQHVQSTYQFDQFTGGFVQLLAAEQTPNSAEWFQGTADAVRQSMHHLRNTNPDVVVILSGDQLFRLDFEEILTRHVIRGAEVTICSTAVEKEDTRGLGILRADGESRVQGFVEKPLPEELTSDMQAPESDDKYMASMGIYVFNFHTLSKILSNSPGIDFGKDIIPEILQSHRVFCDVFEGYWKDIGTIYSFWRASLELTSDNPPFTFYDENTPIYTRPRFLPPSKLQDCCINECMLSEGAIVNGSKIEKSIIGLRSRIGEGTTIVRSIIMGNDFFETDTPKGKIPLGIGENCSICHAIIDKDVRIGNNVTISPEGLEDTENDNYWVRDGIIVIPKGTELPDNTVIGKK